MAEIKLNITKTEVFTFRTTKSMRNIIELFMEKNKIKTRQKFFEDYLMKFFAIEELDHAWKLKED